MTQIINALFGIVFTAVEFVLQTISELFISMVSPKRKTAYKASFGQPHQQLQKSGSGLWVGTEWCTAYKDIYNHSITFGGSGSKKSSCMCFPQLLQANATNYVVHDCSRELYNGTANYLSSIGYNILVLDFDDPDHSIGFNALEHCSTEADVFRLANVLVKNSLFDSSYDYWAQSAEGVIGLFAYALFVHGKPEHRNLPNVAHMIQVFAYAPDKIDAWIVSKNDERLLTSYRSLIATPEKTLQSTLATTKNVLSIYTNPTIAKVVSTNTIDFSKFRSKQKIALFLCGSPTQATYTRGLTASFFETFFGVLLKKLPEPGSMGITFLIDEAGSFNLVSLPKVLEIGRKYLISISTLWQDENQIHNIFNKFQAANILANSKLKVFMPSGQPISTCTVLNQLLGKYEYLDDDGVVRYRDLLSIQEIYQLKEILVLNGNNEPLLIKPKTYFEDKKLKKRTQMPVYEFHNPEPLGPSTLMLQIT